MMNSMSRAVVPAATVVEVDLLLARPELYCLPACNGRKLWKLSVGPLRSGAAAAALEAGREASCSAPRRSPVSPTTAAWTQAS